MSGSGSLQVKGLFRDLQVDFKLIELDELGAGCLPALASTRSCCCSAAAMLQSTQCCCRGRAGRAGRTIRGDRQADCAPGLHQGRLHRRCRWCVPPARLATACLSITVSQPAIAAKP